MTTAVEERAARQVPVVEPLPVTGCGVVSPAGAGPAALKDLLEGGSAAHAEPLAEDAGALPPVPVRTVPGDLSPAAYVGRKGTRRLDRMVGLGLIAGHLALADAGIAADDTARRDVTGVALGTSTGSIRSVWEIAHSAFRPEVPYVPSRFPNSVMNSCAGQLAVWNTLKGVNATLASGHVSAVSALRYARNAIRSGQARAMLAGGAEELTPHLAWAWQRSGVLAPDAVLGEGCAILVVEHPDAVAGRPVVAELLAAETGWFGTRAPGAGPSGIARGLERLVRRALDRSGVTADDVDLVALGAGAHVGARRVEELGVRRALGGLPAVLRLSDVLGDCYSAAAALQGAAVLARWSGGDRPAESLALVTTVGADGHAGCYLLRRTPAGADGAGEVAA